MTGFFRLLLFCWVIIVTGCQKTPEGILPLDKMKVVFFHHIMAEEMLNSFVTNNEDLKYDSARAVLFSGVMKLDKTDSATFARSMDYYKADIVRFKELLDSVNALATREKDERVRIENERMEKKAVADSLARVKKPEPGTLKEKKENTGAKQDSGTVHPK